MTIDSGLELTFTSAAQRILDHLATTSGLATWAVVRDDHDGCRTLAVSDRPGALHANSSLTTPPGRNAPCRVAAPINFPDCRPFAELVGFGREPSADLSAIKAEAQVLGSVLGALAAAEVRHFHERRGLALADGPTDPLTGLATRPGWERRLRLDDAYCATFGEAAAVITVELDDLRHVNELHGHAAGDEQLRVVGAVFSEALTDQHFAARISGDTLGAIILGATPPELEGLEPTLRQALARCEVSTAIGIGRRTPENGFTGALTIANQQIIGTYSVRRTSDADAGLAAALLDAIEHGAIVPYFQPILELRTGDVVALEALARWHSPEGNREPDQFLPQLLQAGLLGALFDRMLDESLRRLVEFRATSPGLRLAVNFEFDTKPVNSMLETVIRLLHRYSLPPDALSLELSERQTFELPGDVRDELFAVADLGVQLMLDDFGTGFASLETLTSLPISGVKLDRRFTGQVVRGERESIVVKTMIALAAETGLSVVAGGIETQAQCDRLVRLGCRLGQGYLFAPPQPADSMAAVLAAPLVSTF